MEKSRSWLTEMGSFMNRPSSMNIWTKAIRLMPEDPLLRAKTRIWIDFFNTRIHPAAHDVAHEKEPDKARERLDTYLQTLEHEMTAKEYIMSSYSLADITFIPFYVRRQRYGVAIDASLPNLKRWGEELIARPAVASTL